MRLTTIGGGDNKIKYMTGEEESLAKKAVGVQEKAKEHVLGSSWGKSVLKKTQGLRKDRKQKRRRTSKIRFNQN